MTPISLIKILIPAVTAYFASYHIDAYQPTQSMRADSICIDSVGRSVYVFANEAFVSQPLSASKVDELQREVALLLPDSLRDCSLEILSSSTKYRLRDIVPSYALASRCWPEEVNNAVKASPSWVTNTSRPYRPEASLYGKHLFVSASHGRYYKLGAWQWQRPLLNATCEDVLTQDIVNPYLLPMLEHAGATIVTSRERDKQSREVVIDNDAPQQNGTYTEHSAKAWQNAPNAGFASIDGLLNDSVQPFTLGTARMTKAVSAQQSKGELPQCQYVFDVPSAGDYAVYVSYQSLPTSISDAHYVVSHSGVRTHFRVNQQMGGNTWCYLGTYHFPKGQDAQQGSVTLYADSKMAGHITTDAVRIGGGCGQHERGQGVYASGLPRMLEGARYYAQWNGIPVSEFQDDNVDNDYDDDIRSRGHSANYIAGGSPYRPQHEGLRVPLCMSLALHTDAGVSHQPPYIGTLGICTTYRDDLPTDPPAATFPAEPRRMSAGVSRMASRDFADLALQNIQRDLSETYSINWRRREIYDRNYGEARTPDLPAIIIEMLSHENFGDMVLAHDPNFRFTLARSIYKSVLQTVRRMHQEPAYTVQPLPVTRFSSTLSKDATEVTLSWSPQHDALEPSATPNTYIIYTAKGADADFDNGMLTDGQTAVTLPLPTGVLMRYKVAAVNAGGESMSSHTLCAYRSTHADAPRLLLVDGFNRLSGPARKEGGGKAPTFDLNEDIGVPYIYTAALRGEISAPANAELTGQVIAGNTLNVTVEHGRAIAEGDFCSFAAMSADAFTADAAHDYDGVDYAAGQNADKPYNLLTYYALPPQSIDALTVCAERGKGICLSGQYILQESQTLPAVRELLATTFGAAYGQTLCVDSIAPRVMYDYPNSQHYFVRKADTIDALTASEIWQHYEVGEHISAVLRPYKHTPRAKLLFAFPLEAIAHQGQRHSVICDAIKRILGKMA